MTNTYQAKYFTGEQLDELMNKVLSKEIAGRGLEIDQNGILRSTMHGYSKLAFSYEHQGNKEVYVTGVDVATGIFTSPAHGFKNGETVVVTVDYPYNVGAPYSVLPGGLLLCENYNNNTMSALLYYVNVVDQDSFTLSTSAGGEAVALTENTGMDVTKFHFEQVPINVELEIAELHAQACLIVVTGKIMNSFRWARATNTVKVGIDGNSIGGIAFDLNYGSDPYGSCKLGSMGYNHLYAELEIKMAGKCQAYQANEFSSIVYNNTVPYIRHIRQFYHTRLTTDEIEGVKLFGNLKGGFFNGAKVEVYTR